MLSQYLPQFNQWMRYQRNANENTTYLRNTIARIFIKDMGDKSPNQYQKEDIWKWREFLVRKGMSVGTQKAYITTIRLLFQFCKEGELTDLDYTQIKPPRAVPPREVLFLNNGELDKFLGMFKNIKYRAICEMLLSTGLRISELLALNRDDVLRDEIKVIGKCSKERTVIITPRAREWLGKYLKTRKDDNPALFLSDLNNRLARGTVENVFRMVREAHGYPRKVTPHTLRHCTGSHLYASTKDLVLTAEYLGHEDIKITKRYYVGLDKTQMRKVVCSGLSFR